KIDSDGATIAGGELNTAAGYDATVAGGADNKALGAYSFAAGVHAMANSGGCFVWGDASTSASINCDTENAWVARASGGVTFYTSGNLSSGVGVGPGGGSWSNL